MMFHSGSRVAVRARDRRGCGAQVVGGTEERRLWNRSLKELLIFELAHPAIAPAGSAGADLERAALGSVLYHLVRCYII